MERRVIVSCVMDEDSRLRMQAWNWLLSLRSCGALATLEPVIHYVGAHPRAFLEQLEGAGARVIEIAPFGIKGSPYCNKIQQAASPAIREADHAISHGL